MVEGTTLEMWRRGNPTVSSNLTSSAEIFLASDALENPSALGIFAKVPPSSGLERRQAWAYGPIV